AKVLLGEGCQVLEKRTERRSTCRSRAALPSPALREQRPQPNKLSLGLISSPAFRLGLGWNQAAVRMEEPDPVVLFPLDFAVPESDGGSEFLAPDPSVLIGLDRLVEAAGQAQPFELSRLGLVHEVFRRAEDPGIKIPLVGAV